MVQRMLRLVFVLVLALGLSHVAVAGGGGKKKTAEEAERTPEQAAVEAYNTGIESRDAAWKIEKELAATTEPAARKKLSAKLEKAFRSAAQSFTAAIGKDPMMYEAHSDLGYCLRKLGDYDASIAAYTKALEIEPRYPNAIEYRAEAYLALNRLEEAKAAYMDLFEGQSDQAPALLEAMQHWVAQNPGDGDFAGWVAERAEIAGQTKSISQLKDADW